MAVALKVKLKGAKELQAMFKRMDPSRDSGRWLTDGLIEVADLVHEAATVDFIIPGGRFFGPRGPRGGKGKLVNRGVDPKRITSRSSRLRDSIAVDHGETPRAIEIGSDVEYAPYHEVGTRTMRRRPIFKPALEQEAPKFEAIFVKHWKREVVR